MAAPELVFIAGRFARGDTITSVSPLGAGLINDTYAVTTHKSTRFVLQRINPDVFPQPLGIIDNLQRLAHHLAGKPAAAVKLCIPNLLDANDGRPYVVDSTGAIWRAMPLIEPSLTLASLTSLDQAREVGFALGHFHRLLSDMMMDGLHDTLPGFHVTPTYLANYQTLSAAMPSRVNDDEDYRACRVFIEGHADRVHSLETAKALGVLLARVVHGDPKLNNVLFDAEGRKAVSLIDLDTVKPGLVHYDIGDCVRSCCHIRERNVFDFDICRAVLSAYRREAGDTLAASDWDYVYAAIWLIPFELGLRFFNDYLAGNRYFKTASPKQNLLRARALFALCDDIGRQQADIERLIGQLSS